MKIKLSTKFLWLWLIVIAVAFSSAGAMVVALISRPITLSPGPAIYYSITTYPADPTKDVNHYEIHRRALSGQDVVLLTISNENRDNGPQFYISPDDKAIFISYSDIIYRFDPATQKKTVIYKPQYQVASKLVFSPDNKKLFIWDGESKSIDNGNQYIALTYDISTGKINTLGKGTYTLGLGFGPEQWAVNDTVLMSQYGKDYVTVNWIYNTSNNKLAEGLTTGPYYQITQQLHVAVPDQQPNGATEECGPFEVAPSTYKLQDLTGSGIGHFGVDNKQVKIVSFSPNDNQVLLEALDYPKSLTECDKTLTSTYYLSDTNGNNVTQVNDYLGVFNRWNLPSRTDVKISPDPSDSTSTDYAIVEGNTVITTVVLKSPKELAILGTTR